MASAFSVSSLLNEQQQQQQHDRSCHRPRPAVLDISNLLNNDMATPTLSPTRTPSPVSQQHHNSGVSSDEEEQVSTSKQQPVKAKRRRANAKQLEVLNRVFERTVFPSTQLRAELGRQLGMSPRTVQIWFQNRRQAIRTRERQRLLRIVRDDQQVSSPSSTSSSD
ncbi:homeobox-domain-containing protein [Lichtheimia hyalospora FSU 10163]|nr:homeobox-domain-containing protein [Lichtheimia hyalospora FSU 10163]